MKPSRVLAFESWEELSAVLTGEQYCLLRHLHGHPEPSVLDSNGAALEHRPGIGDVEAPVQ